MAWITSGRNRKERFHSPTVKRIISLGSNRTNTNDFGHWISQAIKLRALAKTVSTATRDELLRVAREYDLMAVRAQERAQDRCRDTFSEIVERVT